MRASRDKQRCRIGVLITISLLILSYLVAAYAYNLPIRQDPEVQVAEGVGSDDRESDAEPTVTPETEPEEQETEYEVITLSSTDIHRGDLIVVNAQNAYIEDEESLVSVADSIRHGYRAESRAIHVSETIMEPLNDMLGDFNAFSTLGNVTVISGHRTIEYQRLVFNGKALRDGEEEAAKWVAIPGYSEHHTGLAFDLGLYDGISKNNTFKGTGTYVWITENAHKYGFILRYPQDKTDITGISYEPWHFRYVGVPHAHFMNQLDMCLEEYVEYLKNYRQDGVRLMEDLDGVLYEVFYTQETEITVPCGTQYTVSGNNYDGFIITIAGTP